MSTQKFHVNRETGDYGRCRATVRGCPLGDIADHYNSAEEAQAQSEKILHEVYGEGTLTSEKTSGNYQTLTEEDANFVDKMDSLQISNGMLDDRKFNELVGNTNSNNPQDFLYARREVIRSGYSGSSVHRKWEALTANISPKQRWEMFDAAAGYDDEGEDSDGLIRNLGTSSLSDAVQHENNEGYREDTMQSLVDNSYQVKDLQAMKSLNDSSHSDEADKKIRLIEETEQKLHNHPQNLTDKDYEILVKSGHGNDILQDADNHSAIRRRQVFDTMMRNARYTSVDMRQKHLDNSSDEQLSTYIQQTENQEDLEYISDNHKNPALRRKAALRTHERKDDLVNVEKMSTDFSNNAPRNEEENKMRNTQLSVIASRAETEKTQLAVARAMIKHKKFDGMDNLIANTRNSKVLDTIASASPEYSKKVKAHIDALKKLSTAFVL